MYVVVQKSSPHAEARGARRNTVASNGLRLLRGSATPREISFTPGIIDRSSRLSSCLALPERFCPLHNAWIGGPRLLKLLPLPAQMMVS